MDLDKGQNFNWPKVYQQVLNAHLFYDFVKMDYPSVQIKFGSSFSCFQYCFGNIVGRISDYKQLGYFK